MFNIWFELCMKRGYFIKSKRFSTWATDRVLYREYCESNIEGDRVDMLKFIELMKTKLDHRINTAGTVSFKILTKAEHTLEDVRLWLMKCIARGRIVDEWKAVLKPSDIYSAYLSECPACKPVTNIMFGRYLDTVFSKHNGSYSVGINPASIPVPEVTTVAAVDTFGTWLESFKPESPTATAAELYRSYCASVKGTVPLTIAGWGRLMSEHYEKRRLSTGVVYQLYETDPSVTVTLRPELLEQLRNRGGDISHHINQSLEWYLKLC